MPEQTDDRKPWQRQPGEKQHPYGCFCIYRDMGPHRSLRQAIEFYLTMPTAKDATARLRQQRRYQAHPDKARYIRNTKVAWGRWSRRWRWVERCDAYDAWQEIIVAHRTSAERLKAKQEEDEELARWRKRQLDAYVGSQKAGVQGISRLLQLVRAGLMANMPWHSRREVVTIQEVDAKGKPTGAWRRTETDDPGLSEMLPLIYRALVEGRRLENEHRAQPEAGRAAPGGGGLITVFSEMLLRYLPEQYRGEAEEDLRQIAEGSGISEDAAPQQMLGRLLARATGAPGPGERGGPSRLTKETLLGMVAIVLEGNYRGVAAECMGIPAAVFEQWMERGGEAVARFLQAEEAGEPRPEVSDEERMCSMLATLVPMAEAEAHRRMVQAVRAGAEKDPRWAVELLARKFPAGWGKQDKHLVEGGDSPIRHKVTVGIMNEYEDLFREIAEEEAKLAEAVEVTALPMLTDADDGEDDDDGSSGKTRITELA